MQVAGCFFSAWLPGRFEATGHLVVPGCPIRYSRLGILLYVWGVVRLCSFGLPLSGCYIDGRVFLSCFFLWMVELLIYLNIKDGFNVIYVIEKGETDYI